MNGLTAEDYRQLAAECMEGARNATSDDMREHFLHLAKMWTMSAARVEARSVPDVVQDIN
jgi:DNA-binding FadR family transcriptional regulator